MEIRNVGRSDLRVSVVGMGCNNFSRRGTHTETLEGSTEVIRTAIDAGITFFDGADIYGSTPGRSEEFLGAALEGVRDEVVLATKFGHQDYAMPGTEDWGPKGGARYIRRAVEASLRRLRTDRIDLLQMHTPDPETPIEETLAALTDLVGQGKVLYLGHSNFTPEQARDAAAASEQDGNESFISTQNEYSLVAREFEALMAPVADEFGLGVFPYFPLANGLLTGKYTRAGGGEGRLTRQKPALLAATDWDQLEAYQAICDDADRSMLEVTFQWLLSRPNISSVIAGATQISQVMQNTAAGRSVVSTDVLDAVDALFAP
ncbi:Predicted oxidoreductase [Tessaracoccus bendigoensis DSM 12906]|uniref:Predicted oxidoreductase n=1 Tax=Tessaracoccus bendigoensis DSM 12906 TaxID=1123357 RepID=A0A1M6GRM5_9ACTN|nr:aldo/keto reductase [Tessaracoccus bendigoensis]SHJ12625.1 Predicted oxidoreductase [Tessaracoccus bendigoensis DSM 12906]